MRASSYIVLHVSEVIIQQRRYKQVSEVTSQHVLQHAVRPLRSFPGDHFNIKRGQWDLPIRF